MITIAITGHLPDTFLISHYSHEEIKRNISDVVAIFKREHGDDLCFNIGGAQGADMWAGQACMEHNVKFHMFLPFAPETHCKYWEEDQIAEFKSQLARASGLDILSPSDYNPDKESRHKLYELRDKKMVDYANFVVAFWVGRKAGGTYNCMNYALKQSKFVFNALNELKPVFKENLVSGWTPPIKE